MGNETGGDGGRTVDPLLTISQAQGGVGQGGIGQGVGQPMLERTVHDPASGQRLNGSMDRALPRAAALPDLRIQPRGVPAGANPPGTTGAGQTGAMAAAQTVSAAVLDALAPLGVPHPGMPATPGRAWRAVQQAKSRAA